jgi:uridine kinase
VEIPHHDFRADVRRKETRRVAPAAVMLVEGILADERLRAQMDLKLFVDTDADIRVLRQPVIRAPGRGPGRDGGTGRRKCSHGRGS